MGRGKNHSGSPTIVRWFIRTIAPRKWKLAISAWLRLALIVVVIVGSYVSSAGPHALAAETDWQWYKADLHVHSVISGDAVSDLGIISKTAKDLGYNAIFLTDHEAANTWPISGVVSSHVEFDDSLMQWDPETEGTLTTNINRLVTNPIFSGTYSLQLKASSATYGETFVSRKRGPNFRSGDITLVFSVYPTTIDAGSGVYVSVSIGGDPTVRTPTEGYTTQEGLISSDKSIVFVWQLGSARTPSSDPNRRVFTFELPYTLNTWNTYTINVTETINNNVPVEDLPVDYNALTFVKMAAAASNGGNAEAYFDALSLDSAITNEPGDDFVYRNSLIRNYDTSTFEMFPSIEIGGNRHTQRFNFDITQPSELVKHKRGIDAILSTQQSGYPAMLNHPGLPGGVTSQEAIDNQAYGADLIEAVNQSFDLTSTWDRILTQGIQVIGTWTSDMHRVAKLKPATFIYAPALEFNELMHSIFEGRLYMAHLDFPGRVIFNLDSSSSEPYPARYPIYVADSEGTALVHLAITEGLAEGDVVRWIVDGVVVASESATGTSYDTNLEISLAGTFTYVRAEVRDSRGNPKAMAEPIFFIGVPALPDDMSYHIDRITNPDGYHYTKLFTKGITGSIWSTSGEIPPLCQLLSDIPAGILQLSLENPSGSLVRLLMNTPCSPQRFMVDGASIPVADSLETFETATDSSWYYDSSTQTLYLKVAHTSNTATAILEFSNEGDTESPTIPTNLTATPISHTQIDLSWSPSTDNTSVAGYTIYRDGLLLTTVSGMALSYADTSVSPSTTYSYTLDAFDASGNHSAQSEPASATTPDAPRTFEFNSVADAYVDESQPTSKFGTSAKLRVDNAPLVISYLRFDVQGLFAAVTRARLQVYANTSSTTGYDVRSVSDNSWGESTITFDNAPPFGDVIGSSGGFGSNTWTTVDVTPLITGNGTFSLALTTPSTTAVSLASRESGINAPKLIIETDIPDTQAPTKPTNLMANAVGPTQIDLAWSASTDDTGVRGYSIYRDGIKITVVDGITLSYSDTSVSPSTTYSYTVDAFDGSGNHSAQSELASATTPPDTNAPTTPAGLTATASGARRIDLTWLASTDNVAVAGYTIYRDGSLLTTVSGTTLSYSDTSVSPSTTYSYTVDAFDGSGNHSAQSEPASTTTNRLVAFTPVADAYVDESRPTTNRGSLTSLRVDNSPIVISYLRFDVQGLTGPVVSATLEVYANSSGTAGYEVRTVSDNNWDERAITFANAPSTGSVVGSSGSFSSGVWTLVDVTSLITGDGTFSVALSTPSTININLASRESGANAPKLSIEAASTP